MLKADSKMFHDLCEEGIKDNKKDEKEKMEQIITRRCFK